MFQVGQHVICVDDSDCNIRFGEKSPKKGSVYTVRELTFFSGAPGLRLEEIVNAPLKYADGFGEATFFAWRFRPLSSDRLSIFRQHLAPIDKVLT